MRATARGTPTAQPMMMRVFDVFSGVGSGVSAEDDAAGIWVVTVDKMVVGPDVPEATLVNVEVTEVEDGDEVLETPPPPPEEEDDEVEEEEEEELLPLSEARPVTDESVGLLLAVDRPMVA